VPNGGYLPNNGTSFATPHVAGVAALLLQANPELTPPVLANLLRSTADPLPGPRPNNDVGWGRVNAAAAVQAARRS
jgi:subtilisin family serine protease